MRGRSVALVLSLALAVTTLAQVVAGQQNRPPRTADGRPDLNGVWSFATITPFERPDVFAGKTTLTDEEVAAFEKQDEQRQIAFMNTVGGGVGSYNREWYDWGRATNRSSLIVDPRDGKIPPLTAEARARAAARAEARRGRGPSDSWEDRSLAERCIVMSGPPMVPGAYNNNVQIFHTPDHVAFLNEMIHNARIVPLDGRPHGGLRQWSGDSRGRWAGDTLIVDTVKFHSDTSFRGSSPDRHLIERFTRLDARTMRYEFTFEDASTWTTPWTAQITMTRLPIQVYEYGCHEGNYGMANLLSAARAEENRRQ